MHSCPRCEHEAIPERCPAFRYDWEDAEWSQEDQEAPTNPDEPAAYMGAMQALAMIRRARLETM